MSSTAPSIAALLFATLAIPAAAFDLQGHRGARGLRPENTLAAFTFALATGVTTLETDLAVTKDGVLVLSHDPYLNPDLVRAPGGQWLAEQCHRELPRDVVTIVERVEPIPHRDLLLTA